MLVLTESNLAGNMAFNFPYLTVEQIVDAAGELCPELELLEPHFKKPSSLQWSEVYAVMLNEITGTPAEMLTTPMLTTEVEYPEIYSDGFQVMNLNVAMMKVMPRLFVNDFNLGDIISPTTKRLQYIFSAIINYIRFKHSRLPVIHAVKQEIENDREKLETRQKRKEELQQKVNRMRAERAQQEPQVEKVQAEFEKMNVRMQEHIRSGQLQTKTISDLKSKILERNSKKDQLMCDIAKMKEDEAHLLQKIVQSPDKVRADQLAVTQQVEELKQALTKKKLRLGELQNQRKDIKQLVVNCEKGLQLLEHVQTSCDKEAEIRNEMSQIREKIQEVQENERQMNSKQDQLKEMLQSRQEKLVKMLLQHQSRVNVIQQQIECDMQLKDERLQKQNTDSEKQSALLEYKKKCEADMDNHEKKVNIILQAYRHMYGRLLQNISEYNSDCASMYKEKELLFTSEQ